MGDVHPHIDAALRKFIEAQHMFFVATAPERGGHINISPKGLDTFRILTPASVAYLDYVGSGAETIAHLRDNGRITVMLCAFDGPPKIVRLHGTGEVLEPQDAGYELVRPAFPPGGSPPRAIIRINVQRVSTSCGYGVPLYSFEKERTQLGTWADRKGERGLVEYQLEKNSVSIDGLPALRWTDSERT
jgi:hypothetical protein